jgi:hypothetical protein
MKLLSMKLLGMELLSMVRGGVNWVDAAGFIAGIRFRAIGLGFGLANGANVGIVGSGIAGEDAARKPGQAFSADAGFAAHEYLLLSGARYGR